jgi:hypothetical protein
VSGGWIVAVPSWEPGGPLRVVCDRPRRRGLGRHSHLGVSCRRPPAYFSRRETAERIAREMTRRFGRPMVLRWAEWRGITDTA